MSSSSNIPSSWFGKTLKFYVEKILEKVLKKTPKTTQTLNI